MGNLWLLKLKKKQTLNILLKLSYQRFIQLKFQNTCYNLLRKFIIIECNRKTQKLQKFKNPTNN